ncbi:hypothetical protein AB0K40_03070 [Nonomuraea bangladeshensis]|uniref:Uncharacterized protein n=1 Tax=Nonomuraea bangladeshensis TaxID=404385 RepID=A0ABV3GW19_9ACTN
MDLLAYEESTVLPLVQRHLSVASLQEAEQAAWQALGRLGPAVTLPRLALPWLALSSLALSSLALPWLAHDTPRDELGHVLAHTGGPIARVLLALTRRRFERERHVAFRWL